LRRRDLDKFLFVNSWRHLNTLTFRKFGKLEDWRIFPTFQTSGLPA
jgi:hypothetical protein